MDVLDGFGHGVRAADAVRQMIYTPAQRPGFAAWATAFAYGDGRIGLSFKETVRGRDPQYRPPRLELGEAVGAPVSYCSVECGSENECSYRVYLVSSDGGQTFSGDGALPAPGGGVPQHGPAGRDDHRLRRAAPQRGRHRLVRPYPRAQQRRRRRDLGRPRLPAGGDRAVPVAAQDAARRDDPAAAEPLRHPVGGGPPARHAQTPCCRARRRSTASRRAF